ncbi:MAG: threonine/homoserine/homoserine lactone efflux protein [Paracoccaceae bacterium]|jgi:threonine/homoserine/homoserine lactone efflux protein
MGIEHLIAYNIALLVSILSPGPSMIYLIRNTLTGGRRTGIVTAIGLGVMAVCWTIMALLGLGGVFRVFPWAYTTFKIVGAGFLIYIAWSTWRNASAPIVQTGTPRSHRAFLGSAFLGGILVNLGNPKSVLFAAAVLLVIFPADLSALDKILIAANHLAVELTLQPLLAILLSTGAISRRYLAIKPTLDRIAALALGAIGGRLLLDR